MSLLSHSHENADRVVFLTSPTLSKSDIFRNGLYQNIFVLYELVETLGYKSYFFVDKPLADVSGALHLYEGFRAVDMNAFAAAPFKLHTVIEIGVGLSPDTRAMFRNLGPKGGPKARMYKLYLGNVLNIDIEIPTCIPPMNFSHHYAGELDETWTSPHYLPHTEYIGVINDTMIDSANLSTSQLLCRSRVVPYVWSSRFIESPEHGRATYYKPRKGPHSFTIIEPNISFQKCSLIPLMILEKLYRESPELVDQVIVISGDKLLASPYFDVMIKPRLHLVRDGRVTFSERMPICDIMEQWPDHIVVANQILNEFNYIMMEHMRQGFPYAHNCPSLREYGYYYDGVDIASGVTAIRRIIDTHDKRQMAYKAEAAQLEWKFSHKNPENLAEWGRLLA